MKKLTVMALCLVMPVVALASGGGVHLDPAHIDLENRASLQRGAKLFVNYCLSCHSASYMRYNRMAEDLGLTQHQVEENMMFVGSKFGETMTVAMNEADAEAWFGTRIPDLTVTARVRGPDWLYTYLRSFYLDPSRPFGVNNTVFKDVGMPHVLGERQGWQQAVYRTEQSHGEEGHAEEGAAPVKVLEKLELVTPGTSTPKEYDLEVRDLVAFMTYMGEPIQLERKRIGRWVILFLIGFLVLAYLLKREYWKDVH